VVGVSVTFVGVAVTRSGGAVTLIGGPVTLIGGTVRGDSPGRGLFTRGAGLVTGRFGRLSRASRLVAELCLPVAFV
jgi:hypothetical protein